MKVRVPKQKFEENSKTKRTILSSLDYDVKQELCATDKTRDILKSKATGSISNLLSNTPDNEIIISKKPQPPELKRSSSSVFHLGAETPKGRKILRNSSYSELPLGENANYKPPKKIKYDIKHLPYHQYYI